MKIIVIVVATLVLAILIIVPFILISEPDGLINASDIETEWIKFKATHNKFYNESENDWRKAIYLKSKSFIAEHNKRYAKGLVTYTLGINRFADLRDNEYIGKALDDSSESEDEEYGSSQFYDNLTRADKFFLAKNTLRYNFTYAEDLPQNVDWVEYGYKNPILSQGHCGSCYIFSSLAAIEAHYYIKYKTLLQLSHQEILDCARAFGTSGCRGGFMNDVYNYVMLQGVGLSDQNPYMAEETGDCRQTNPRIKFRYQYFDRNANEEVLKEVIAKFGPVTSAINAGLPTFKFYRSGVYYDPECTSDEMQHGVTTVGYGVRETDGMEYWKVRNSFGADWGNNGYMLLARNRDNHCGLAKEYIFPGF